MTDKTEKQDSSNEDSIVKVNVVMSAFPMSKWMEWDKDCKDNYGDCRWMKAAFDHEFVKHFKVLHEQQVEKIIVLESRLNELESKPVKEKKNTVKTLAGEVEV